MSRKVLKPLSQSWALLIGGILICGIVLGGCASNGGQSSSVAHTQAHKAQSKTTDKAQKQSKSPSADQTNRLRQRRPQTRKKEYRDINKTHTSRRKKISINLEGALKTRPASILILGRMSTFMC